MNKAERTYATLALRLLAPYASQNLSPENPLFGFADEIAKGIIAEPQAHIDALVEAGVLRHDHGLDHHLYAVVKPHVHDWCVSQSVTPALVVLHCYGCDTGVGVPNRLPIEIPS